MGAFYDRMLAPAGVTLCQFSLLRRIGENPRCSIRTLSERTGLDRSTLSRNLRPLLSEGLVEDGKKEGACNCVLMLSEVGMGVEHEARLLWEEAQKKYEELLGQEQVKQLEEILEKLSDLE